MEFGEQLIGAIEAAQLPEDVSRKLVKHVYLNLHDYGKTMQIGQACDRMALVNRDFTWEAAQDIVENLDYILSAKAVGDKGRHRLQHSIYEAFGGRKKETLTELDALANIFMKTPQQYQNDGIVSEEIDDESTAVIYDDARYVKSNAEKYTIPIEVIEYDEHENMRVCSLEVLEEVHIITPQDIIEVADVPVQNIENQLNSAMSLVRKE